MDWIRKTQRLCIYHVIRCFKWSWFLYIYVQYKRNIDALLLYSCWTNLAELKDISYFFGLTWNIRWLASLLWQDTHPISACLKLHFGETTAGVTVHTDTHYSPNWKPQFAYIHTCAANRRSQWHLNYWITTTRQPEHSRVNCTHMMLMWPKTCQPSNNVEQYGQTLNGCDVCKPVHLHTKRIICASHHTELYFDWSLIDTRQSTDRDGLSL